ncbi:hypothetical protein QEG98_42045 (plasmid) [Myxococcus sp. MxC21-1]|uniref:hypothetical protein n=1 Tax=Myxococcus sp. MxC21-1 TaxID=3041439 RepID=UPI00292F82D3|nr:hypothetical protein [Myxococcus sp. MxC21-1]WNZ66203.1 hypothetical protein QEG98_42045 [Myxococcus sp. MxC21-1]
MPNDDGDLTGPQKALHRALREVRAAQDRRSRWPDDGREAMTKLARLFPSLAKCPGITPWDQEAVLGWLCAEEAPTVAAATAATFVLTVWNSFIDWREPAREMRFAVPDRASRFDILAAMTTWTPNDVTAARAWVDAPFWP